MSQQTQPTQPQNPRLSSPFYYNSGNQKMHHQRVVTQPPVTAAPAAPASTLGNWQAPIAVDQVSLHAAQINHLQKTLDLEVANHNHTRSIREHYRQASLGWERHYCAKNTEIESLSRLMAEARKRAENAEMKCNAAEQYTGSIQAEYDRLLVAYNGIRDKGQEQILESPLSIYRTPTYSPDPPLIPHTEDGLPRNKRKTRFGNPEQSYSIPSPKRTRSKANRPATPRAMTLEELKEDVLEEVPGED